LNSNQQSKVKLVELELNQVECWTYPRVTFDQSLKEYGELFAPLLEEYYKTYDPIVFDRNKELLLSEYNKLIYGESTNPKQHSLFFNRLKKIIYLYRIWNKLQHWKDPLLIKQRGYYNGKPFYTAHPGRDRLLIMKHFRIPSYKFLLVDDLTPEMLPELQQLWPSCEIRFEYGKEWSMIISNSGSTYGQSLYRWLSDPTAFNTISTISNPSIVTPRMLALQKLSRK
jgi:hypothetical protein